MKAPRSSARATSAAYSRRACAGSRPGSRRRCLVAGKDLAIELAHRRDRHDQRLLRRARGGDRLARLLRGARRHRAGRARRHLGGGRVRLGPRPRAAPGSASGRTAALAGLLVTPTARSAIFAGKALGVLLFMTLVELIVVPVTALLFSVDLVRVGPGLALFCLAATPGHRRGRHALRRDDRPHPRPRPGAGERPLPAARPVAPRRRGRHARALRRRPRSASSSTTWS